MTKNESNDSGYHWKDAKITSAHDFLLPALIEELEHQPHKRLFDLGCGNGSVANELNRLGWNVTGVDPSVEGIRQAKSNFNNLTLNIGSAYDDLESIYGSFPVVISLEVVEHVYYPRKYAQTLLSLCDSGGT